MKQRALWRTMLASAIAVAFSGVAAVVAQLPSGHQAGAATTPGDLFEYVSDHVGTHIWNAYDQSANSGGPAITSPAGTALFGTLVHVYAAGTNGDLMEFISDHANGRVWNAYNQTATSGGPTIVSQPSTVVIGADIHVDAEATNGDLIEFVNDGAAGRIWNAYDLTLFSGGPTITSSPRAVDLGGIVHVYGQAPNGHLTEFVSDHVAGRVWNAYDQTANAGGTTIASSPEAAVLGGLVHVYARATSGDLVEFLSDHASGRVWNAYDLTGDSGGPRVASAPSTNVTPSGVIQVFAAGSVGQLEEYQSDHVGGRVWNAYNLSASGGGPDIAGRPSVVSQGTIVHVEAQSVDNDLIDFYTNDGNSWGAADITADAGGPSVLAPSVLDLGGVIHVYVPASPPNANCSPDNSCTPQTFADTLLSQPGVTAPITASNEYALERWALAEGGGAGCPGQPANQPPWSNSGGPAGNPLNTTQPEPGSSPWNFANVQIFADGSGHTCWYWGVLATQQTITGAFGNYGPIISALQNPVAGNTNQCDRVAVAVGNSQWGTGNFSRDC
jgi:hypothetical protein